MSTNQNNGFSTQDVWILRCQQHFSRSSADSHKKHNTPNRTAASTNQNFNKTIICNIPSLPPLPLPLSLTPQLHPSSATAWPTTQWSEPWLPTIACPTVRMSRECSKSVKPPKVMTAFAKWPCNTWTCVSLKNNQTRRKRKEIQWKDYSWHQSLTWHLPAVSCHVCENVNNIYKIFSWFHRALSIMEPCVGECNSLYFPFGMAIRLIFFLFGLASILYCFPRFHSTQKLGMGTNDLNS